MSEVTNQTTTTEGSSSDVEALKANRDAILSEKQELKTKYDQLAEKSNKLESTLTALGQLVGVGEGEDVATKAQELIKAKEQEAFEKMSDIEKLNHRLKGLEEELTNNKLAKEKAEKEALGLKIDSTLKDTLSKNGVSEDALELALVGIKAKSNFTGLQDGNLLTEDSQVSPNAIIEKFLETNKYLVKNPAKKGSSFKGGAPEEKATEKQTWDRARKSKNYRGVISNMLAQQKGE